MHMNCIFSRHCSIDTIVEYLVTILFLFIAFFYSPSMPYILLIVMQVQLETNILTFCCALNFYGSFDAQNGDLFCNIFPLAL